MQYGVREVGLDCQNALGERLLRNQILLSWAHALHRNEKVLLSVDLDCDVDVAIVGGTRDPLGLISRLALLPTPLHQEMYRRLP